MREHRAFFRRLACALGLAALVTMPALATWKICNAICVCHTREVLARLPSPTGAWTAILSENTAEGLLSTAFSADVELISRERPYRSIAVLGVDTHGRDNLRPGIAWSAPDVLRVTVPNLSVLRLLNRHADGVQVDIQFDPDDPAARAAWLKQMGLPTDGP